MLDASRLDELLYSPLNMVEKACSKLAHDAVEALEAVESFDVSGKAYVNVRASCAQAGAEMLLGRGRVSKYLADMFHRNVSGDEVMRTDVEWTQDIFSRDFPDEVS